MNSSHSVSEFLALFKAQIEVNETLERRARRKDDYKIPSNVYEIIEDLGKIECALAGMKSFWHKDNDDFRKASMHLSKLAWDLRKKLHDYL